MALLDVSLTVALLGVGKVGGGRGGGEGQNLSGQNKEKLGLGGGARATLDGVTGGKGERVWVFSL